MDKELHRHQETQCSLTPWLCGRRYLGKSIDSAMASCWVKAKSQVHCGMFSRKHGEGFFRWVHLSCSHESHCKESLQGIIIMKVIARSHCKESSMKESLQGVIARSHCKESLQGVIARSHCKLQVQESSHCKESLQGVIARSHCKQSLQGVKYCKEQVHSESSARSHCKESHCKLQGAKCMESSASCKCKESSASCKFFFFFFFFFFQVHGVKCNPCKCMERGQVQVASARSQVQLTWLFLGRRG